jgi:3-phenylpropionate/trans-cinnamate dioxygenase ferredoxin component
VTRHLVGKVSRTEPRSLSRVDAGGVPVCLARLEDGTFRSIDDVCTHEGASLSGGEMYGNAVVCPLHSSQFDLSTGAVVGMPAQEPVKAYPVLVDDDDIYVVIVST